MGYHCRYLKLKEDLDVIRIKIFMSTPMVEPLQSLSQDHEK